MSNELCAGSGTIPPRYQGATEGSSTAFAPACCGVCGYLVAVDGYMRAVTHGYRDLRDEHVCCCECDALRTKLEIAREALFSICKNHGGRLVAGDECECRDVQIARGALAKIGEGKPPSPGERSKGGEG